MIQQLEAILEEAKAKIRQASDLNELGDLKALYLGKKSAFSAAMQDMRMMSESERPLFGQRINAIKAELSTLLEQAKTQIEKAVIEKKLQSEAVDITLPGKPIRLGATHLVTQIIEEIENLFVGMGYTIEEGPEVELDKYNFEMLNLPKDHPARDMQDSFYITEETLLRTHTSPVQVRAMLANHNQRPFKIICPGKVYRNDDEDKTHSHQFSQIEALVVDENTSLSDLKGTLLLLARTLFGEERQIRMRPSFFPFTEPSVEVDISCHRCNGAGCSLCKGTGWIEILGAGMVNNAVLSMAGYDPEKYQGFAFGVGVERVAILRHAVDDIRQFFVNDMRFNRQFR
ncbi:MAG: phenylalanine--tRNA ligase subunit alpha [Candidatus Izemoplasmatales bacterium]|nr:phenylalanine--tRNA ligase subunit alpha [Candidatus Izemoplasmatales bacterium]